MSENANDVSEDVYSIFKRASVSDSMGIAPANKTDLDSDKIRSQAMDSSVSSSQMVDPQCYFQAESQAREYFETLEDIANKNDFLTKLSQDYQQWKKYNRTSIKHNSLSHQIIGGHNETLEDSSSLDTHSVDVNSWSFLKKLHAERNLKHYLTKSIRYIFMRDLGLSLADKTTQKNIDQLVTKLNGWIKNNVSNSSGSGSEPDSGVDFSDKLLYEKARQYGVEQSYCWLMAKLALVQQYMPEGVNATQGSRKLVKIIAGVVLHQLMEMPEQLTDKEKSQKVERAIQLGYCYGLTYPFIDDLQDSAVTLSTNEQTLFNNAIRESLLSGTVVDCPEFSEKNKATMQFVYTELKQAFELIKQHLPDSQSTRFFQQAYVFFEAQNIDRARQLSDENISASDLFMPIILKSSGCRQVAKDIVSDSNDSEFSFRTFCFGIYNQFNDDIKDIFDDIKEKAVTPYSYHLHKQNHSISDNSANPYRIYWSVVFYLIHEVYGNEPQAKSLLLERSINAHRSLRQSIGEQSYDHLRQQLLSTGDFAFDQMFHQLVVESENVAWFDKFVSTQVTNYFQQSQQASADFKHEYQSIQNTINKHLDVTLSSFQQRTKSLHNGYSLTRAANYSLSAGGKRLRGVLAYVTGVYRYGLEFEQIKPVFRLIEYMHTASIIFDDKPSQDNSDLRRGSASLHKHLQCEASAELTGISLMMKAVEVQSSIPDVPQSNILQSLQYSARVTQAICDGQLMDLKCDPSTASIEQLETLCFLKTGLAIEASLLIPAILAGENDIQKSKLKEFARHLGLAFQIKDDLLDATGNEQQLGKPLNQDSQQNKATFVTCLGVEGASTRMFHHYYRALDLLDSFPEMRAFMSQVSNYVIYRDS